MTFQSASTLYWDWRSYQVQVGPLLVVIWWVVSVASIVAARMPLYGSLSFVSADSTWRVRTIILMAWHILLMMPLARGFLIVVTPKSPWTVSANLLINSLPLSYTTWVGCVYRVNHVCSTMLAIALAFVLIMSRISNHPVVGIIMVTHHNMRFFHSHFLMV
jgi:hypothetical protein